MFDVFDCMGVVVVVYDDVIKVWMLVSFDAVFGSVIIYVSVPGIYIWFVFGCLVSVWLCCFSLFIATMRLCLFLLMYFDVVMIFCFISCIRWLMCVVLCWFWGWCLFGWLVGCIIRSSIMLGRVCFILCICRWLFVFGGFVLSVVCCIICTRRLVWLLFCMFVVEWFMFWGCV